MSSRPTTTRPLRSGIGEGAGLDDADEGGWMFISIPQPPSAAQKIAQRFSGKPIKRKFRRQYLRVAVRGGVATIFVHESDDPDELPLHMFDLSAVVNVTKFALSSAEALSFLCFDEKGDSLVEPVHGQIGLCINLGPLGELALAFASVEDRDAWGVWFSELVVFRDLHEMELQANESTLPPPDLSNVMQWGLSRDGRKATRDFTRAFLQSSGRTNRPEVAPNKGKLEVRDPGSRAYRPCILSAKMHAGEVHFELRRSRENIFGAFGTAPDNLHLSEASRIVASLPWSVEFQVMTDDHAVWSFQAKTVEVRNAFVQWMRLVKGRGRQAAQTEHETFPFLTAADAAMAKASAASERVILQFLADGSGGGDSDAGGASSRRGGRGDDDDDDTKSVVGGEDGDAKSSSAAASPSPTRISLQHEDAWMDRDTPRSGDTIGPHSVKPFEYFPPHWVSSVLPYVQASTAIHMAGRPLDTLLRSRIAQQSGQRRGSTRGRSGGPRGSSAGAHLRGSVRLRALVAKAQGGLKGVRPWSVNRGFSPPSRGGRASSPVADGGSAIKGMLETGTSVRSVLVTPHFFSNAYGLDLSPLHQRGGAGSPGHMAGRKVSRRLGLSPVVSANAGTSSDVVGSPSYGGSRKGGPPRPAASHLDIDDAL
jgi:hypothetical protein